MNMVNNFKENKNTSSKESFFYSIGQLSDISAYQTFTFLVFTFYYAVIKIPIIFIMVGFVIWAIWNSFNDFLLGYLSDRTNTKWGRRKPFIIISILPLSFIMILLFTPPSMLGLNGMIINFIYFLIIIITFEFFFTMYDLNYTALFPELFISVRERTKANNFRQIFAIIGLIMAFVMPGFIIDDYSTPTSALQYPFFGIIIAIIILIPGLLFLKLSPKEKKEFQNDYMTAPKFVEALKTTIKSKSFLWYIPAEVAIWFVYGMLPAIIPLYGKYVLQIENTLILSLLLGIAFISAGLFMTILWKPLVQRIGPRKSWLMSLTIWIGTLIPLMFISDMISGIIVFFLMGIGLSGSLYIIDIIIGDIIDEDEIKTGIRREGAYYGLNMFLMHLSTVLVFVIIGPVFIISDWEVFNPLNITKEVIFGLRSLVSLFPIIALLISIIVIYKYPLDGQRLLEVKKLCEKIHQQKRAKL